MSPLSYEALLVIDHDLHKVHMEAPEWMRDDSIAVPSNSPAWVDWQRKVYIVGRKAGGVLTVALCRAQSDRAAPTIPRPRVQRRPSICQISRSECTT